MRKWIVPIEHGAMIVTVLLPDAAKMAVLAALEEQVGKDIFFWADIGKPTEILDKPVLIEYLNEEFQTLD